MKLYYSKGACSLAIRILLHEIGIPSEFEAVDLKTKRTETNADFLALNPKGAVPTLITDKQEVLTENAVILCYLADEYKATELLPAPGNFRRYRVLEWLNYVATELHKGAGVLFNPKLPQDIKNEFFIPLLKNKLHFLEQRLNQNAYLMGNSCTLPDLYLFVILSWLKHFHINLADWKQTAQYFSKLQKRPSITQSLQEENLL